MRKFQFVPAFIVAAAVPAFGPAPANAQSVKASTGIEEVVVTAQRREEVLARVPMSISAFTADRIEQLNAKNFGDLVAYTPGVNFDATSNNISIRGVNS